MASKLGFLLSLFFVVQIIAYSGDLCSIQMLHSLLDATSITAGRLISTRGGLTPEIVDFVEKQSSAYIVQLSEKRPSVGDIMIYKIYRDYRPLVISDSIMEISVVRSTVIGYID